MTIVTHASRPKRKAQATTITVPTIVTAKRSEPLGRCRATIVTAKNPHRHHGRFGDVPDMTPEEYKRRGDAADALFREMKRQIAEKLREE